MSQIYTKADLAVLGPANTQTDLAANYFFKTKNPTKIYATSIPGVFELVVHGNAVKGVVPLENNGAGPIEETFIELKHQKVRISHQFDFSIHHSLVALPGSSKEQIESIASHEQALKQCRKFLDKNYPHAKLVASPSSMAAWNGVLSSKDKKAAVIMATETAESIQLNILAKNIEDDKNNFTTFIVIEKSAS